MAKVLPALYSHVQSESAAVWTINHNLSGNGSLGVPIVDTSIDVNGVLTKILAKVDIIDRNTLTVTFSSPQVGIASVII
jgi:hypothetical protein